MTRRMRRISILTTSMSILRGIYHSDQDHVNPSIPSTVLENNPAEARASADTAAYHKGALGSSHGESAGALTPVATWAVGGGKRYGYNMVKFHGNKGFIIWRFPNMGDPEIIQVNPSYWLSL
jgi:hypothetical protein